MTRLVLPEPLKNLEYTRRKTGLWVPSVLRGMGLSQRGYGARKCCCGTGLACGPYGVEASCIDDQNLPAEWEIVMEGWTNPAEFNGTFILPASGGICWLVTYCHAVYCTSNDHCIQIHVRKCDTNQIAVLCHLDICGVSTCTYSPWWGSFRKDYGDEKIDCLHLEDIDIPLHGLNFGTGTPTCKVSSL